MQTERLIALSSVLVYTHTYRQDTFILTTLSWLYILSLSISIPIPRLQCLHLGLVGVLHSTTYKPLIRIQFENPLKSPTDLFSLGKLYTVIILYH